MRWDEFGKNVSLEKAMAVELSPHERNISRMRNGLEDG
jgi:hypothetical protein